MFCGLTLAFALSPQCDKQTIVSTILENGMELSTGAL